MFLKYFNNLTPLGQIDTIYDLIKPLENQIVQIELERNSIGSTFNELLKQRLQPNTQNKIIEFNTTNQSKADIVTKLQVGFEQQQIRILPEERQLRELSYFSAEYNPKTKVVTYNAPQGLHDDICMSLMFAWDAFKQSTYRGNYSISVIKHR